MKGTIEKGTREKRTKERESRERTRESIPGRREREQQK
jgi:hypothetical protein